MATPFEAIGAVLKSRKVRDPYAPQTPEEQMDAKLQQDPGLALRNRIAKMTSAIQQSGQ